MASTPNYEGAKRTAGLIMESVLGTDPSVAVMTAVPNGTRIKEIRIHSRGTAPGANKKLAVIIDDSLTAPIVDIVSLSNTADTRQAILRYDNLFLTWKPELDLGNQGAKLKFQLTDALPVGAAIHIEVLAADF